MSLGETALSQLYYWYRDVPGSTAEIDFLLAGKNGLIPIEVKAGKTGKLRSLREFILASKGTRAMRVYSGPLRQEKVSIGQISFDLLSLPFYLLPRIKSFAD